MKYTKRERQLIKQLKQASQAEQERVNKMIEDELCLLKAWKAERGDK